MKYICRKIPNDLDINGNLNKPEWQKAMEVKLLDNITGHASKLDTYARLLWNNDYLYAGFQCRYETLCATMTEYNDKLYNEDVVELFIDDDRDSRTYIEIEVNPLNAVLHYCIHNDLQGKTLTFARTEKVINSSVICDEENKTFSVELAIPLNEFSSTENMPPQNKDRWHFNLYRIDRMLNGLVEYSALSPTYKANFHIPSAFVELEFEQ
ncbi:MAG: hypothetical protein K0R50_1187 [Eubacterium sp.]|nr:hypothetical protein [Eubacterium sp.]